MQLDVKDLDKIERNGTSVGDRLVLGLQGWLSGDKVSWVQLITAIFQPAGGNNKRMAREVTSSFRGIREHANEHVCASILLFLLPQRCVLSNPLSKHAILPLQTYVSL